MFGKAQAYAKFIVAMIGAVGTTTLVAIFSGGITPETIIAAVVSLLTALSVYGVPNTPVTTAGPYNDTTTTPGGYGSYN